MLSNIKKILYPAVLLIFLAFTFSRRDESQSNPPGWYQQTVPVNKNISDIYFHDSLNGFAVTEWAPEFDTAFALKTTNGGQNWNINFKGNLSFSEVQMFNKDTVYACGGDGRAIFFRTYNGGVNWQTLMPFGAGVNNFGNMFFVNTMTGWVSSSDGIGGGVFKTINGGVNWVRQLNVDNYRNLFFLNRDTGWVVNNGSQKQLMRTINGGANWNVQYISEYTIESLFFLNNLKGWMRGGQIKNTMGVAYTTDGGFNWINATGEVGGFDIKFVNDSIGYSGAVPFKITKSTDGGRTWGKQVSPIGSNICIAVLKGDTSKVWAGRSGIVHTTDGGGPIMDIEQISTELPVNYNLSQNYPNPFNPTTKISFSVKRQTSNVRLSVYDMNGKLIETLISKSLPAGTYETNFNANNLSSGIYFYTLITDNFFQTKKMILLK